MHPLIIKNQALKSQKYYQFKKFKNSLKRKQSEEKPRFRLPCLKSGIWLIQNPSPYLGSAIADAEIMQRMYF
jgi:hypothetical protein